MALAFADTFYWIALMNPHDAAHERVVGFDIAPARPGLVTTEEILIEFLTFFSGRGSLSRAKAVSVARGVATNTNVRVIPQSHESYLSGLELYASRLDNGFSLTDCISMQAMRREEREWCERVTMVWTIKPLRDAGHGGKQSGASASDSLILRICQSKYFS